MFGISISGGLDVDANYYKGKSTFFSRLKVQRVRLGVYLEITFLNPLSPNSDRQQFSPNGIHTMSRD